MKKITHGSLNFFFAIYIKINCPSLFTAVTMPCFGTRFASLMGCLEHEEARPIHCLQTYKDFSTGKAIIFLCLETDF